MPNERPLPVGPQGLPEILLSTLLHDTTLAVAITDADGVMAFLSPALESMLGRSFEAVSAEEMPRHFQVHTPDGSRLLRPAEVPITRARSGESFSDVEVVVHRPDGSVAHLSCSGAPLRQDDGAVTGGIVLVTDVTAERAVVREQGVLRDRLVETVNHELRTPLTKLLGHAELLEESLDDVPPPVRRSLTAVIRAGEALGDLARSVSELVDLDSAARAHRQPVDAALLVRAAVDARLERAAGRGVGLRLESPVSARAELDVGPYRKAVGCLLDNAVGHAPAGSEVVVALRLHDGTLALEISDSGPGIPLRDRERVRQPFERGQGPEQQAGGRGLGLAVAEAVAVAHRGALLLSDNPPHGLRVVLRVRAVQDP